MWLSWKDVKEFSSSLGLDVVPEIMVSNRFEQIDIPLSSSFGPVCEGYVVRNAECYDEYDFSRNVAKCVREDHVKTDKHWTENWKKASFLEDPIERMYRLMS
jgi:hypothetical protein